MYEWLSAAVLGEHKLDAIYTNKAAGTLSDLRERRVTAKAAASDADLVPWVDKWVKDGLQPRVAVGKIAEISALGYERHVRRLIPAGTVFPKSQFNEDYLKAELAGYSSARNDRPLSDATRLHHYRAWQLFYKWARKRVPLTVNPFEDADWAPATSNSREITYNHEQVMSVLEHMQGEARAALAVLFGSGIELGALVVMKGSDVIGPANDGTGRGLIVAHGTKNGARRNRTIYVDAWAWSIFKPHADTILPRGSVWSFDRDGAAHALREPFYRAQVTAGLIDKPKRVGKVARRDTWSTVNPHTLHDCRHSYVTTRLLGDDGEEAQSIGFCSVQLGHTDEGMVIRIYNKKNMAQRIQGIQRQQAAKAMKRAGGAR